MAPRDREAQHSALFTDAGGGRNIGRYVVYDEIASGGMASVHLGRLLGSVGFARTVAVKCLHAGLTKEAEFVSMLLDEAHLASRIRHPNVVQMIDVVSHDDDVFLVMEYVHGESLSNLIRRAADAGDSIPLSVAVSVISGMLLGLHAAHEASGESGAPLGIVHRDVSPQNILVGVDGVPRVFDFGVSKAASRLQSTWDGQLKGKLRYMSPEQLQNRPIDRRSDLFAASAVLWEALTARRLFEGSNPGAIVTRILSGDVQRPSEVAPHVPAELDEIVMRGLAMDPAARFETARDMAIALEGALAPATPRAVGEWVEQVARDAIAGRAALIAAMEGAAQRRQVSPAAADDVTARVSADPSGSPAAPSGALNEELDATSVSSAQVLPRLEATAARPPDSRRSPLWWALGAAALTASVFVGSRLVAEPAEPPEVVESALTPAVAKSAAVASTPPEPGVASAQASVSARAPGAASRPAPTLRPVPAAKAPAVKAPVSKRPSCDPPFVIKDGIKEFKRECL